MYDSNFILTFGFAIIMIIMIIMVIMFILNIVMLITGASSKKKLINIEILSARSCMLSDNVSNICKRIEKRCDSIDQRTKAHLTDNKRDAKKQKPQTASMYGEQRRRQNIRDDYKYDRRNDSNRRKRNYAKSESAIPTKRIDYNEEVTS